MESYHTESDSSKELSEDLLKRIKNQNPESFLLHSDINVNMARNGLKTTVKKNKYVNVKVKKAVTSYLNTIKIAIRIQYKEKSKILTKQMEEDRDNLIATIATMDTTWSFFRSAVLNHMSVLASFAHAAIVAITYIIAFSLVRGIVNLLPASVKAVLTKIAVAIINYIRRIIGRSQIKNIEGRNIYMILKTEKAVDAVNKMEKTIYRLSKGKIKLPKIKSNPKVKK